MTDLVRNVSIDVPLKCMRRYRLALDYEIDDSDDNLCNRLVGGVLECNFK